MMDQAHDPEQQIAERYFLGELDDPQAEAFEAHYFECPSCAEYVVETQMMFDGGREFAREKKAAPAPAPVVDINERRARWRQWIPTAAAAMMVIALGVPRFLPPPVLSVELLSRIDKVELAETRDEAPPAKIFPVGPPFVLDVRVSAPAAGSAVEVSVRDATTRKLVRSARRLTEEEIDKPVFMLLRELPAGSYDVVIESVAGNRRIEIDTQRFEVQVK
jgi:anti-sigma factor RsiW